MSYHKAFRGGRGRAPIGDVGRCETTGKLKFTDKKLAKRKDRTHGGKANVFRCEFCGNWHIGHGRNKPRELHREIARTKYSRDNM